MQPSAFNTSRSGISTRYDQTPQKYSMELRSGHKTIPTNFSTASGLKKPKRKLPARPPVFNLTTSPQVEQSSPELAPSFAELLPSEPAQDWAQGIENVFFENSDDDEFDIKPFPFMC